MEAKQEWIQDLNAIQPFSGTVEEMSQGQALFQEGRALQRTQTAYTTAVQVQKPRQIAGVAHNVLKEAKLAKSSFYYGWPVKNKDGSVTRVEGPSIDLAMCLARNYGNCAIDVEGEENNTHFMLKGVFIDLESGFTCPRLFRQRKTQSLGGKMQKDADRQEDIVFQIGQSKAIRNAIVRAMPAWLIDQAIEVAKRAEISGINEENIHLARQKVLAFFEPYGVSSERIEAKVGKAVDEWTARDIADLRGMATALKEGRISADALFPKPEPPKEEPESQDQAQERKPKPAVEPQKEDEKKRSKTDDSAISDEAKALRQEFISLREAGFSSWVWKNRDRLEKAPESVRVEAKEKWERLYPEDYFPLDPVRDAEPQTEPSTEAPAINPAKEEGDDWRSQFEIASRQKACLEKNKKLTYELLEQHGGYKRFSEVPKENMLDILAAIEGEVFA
jgi:hypothetical protein